MEQYQLRALENAFKHDRFKGLFGFNCYNGGRDADRERAMSLENPENNPYVSMFAAMSAMTVSMEAMMQDVEGRIKACPTGQLFSLVMNRYNPAWSLANVIPGYIIRVLTGPGGFCSMNVRNIGEAVGIVVGLHGGRRF